MITPVSAGQVLDAALELARDRHWEKVRLADVAARLGCGLHDIHAHYPDKEALVDAWWDRADSAMLSAPIDGLDLAARVETLVLAWLETFAAHRETARQMLEVRLEPGHLHIQIPTLIRTSRTVQWLREAAGMHQPLPFRAIDETAMTTLFVATCLRWLRSGDEETVRRMLRKGLELREQLTGSPGKPGRDDRSD